MKKIIYMRKSTENQSYKNQELYFKNKFNDMENVTVYKESYTGKSKERPVLKTMLEDIINLSKEGEEVILYTKALDRVARNTTHLLEIINVLDKYDVTADFGNFEYKPNDPTSKLIVTVLGSVAELELSLRSNRAKESLKEYWEAKAPNGITEEKINVYKTVKTYLQATGESLNKVMASKTFNISKTTYIKINKWMKQQEEEQIN